MNRRQFLGSTIGASLAIGGLLRLPSSLASPSYQNPESYSTLVFTDGEIAVNNHLSSLARLRSIFEAEPSSLASSSAIINGELLNSQFLGDYLSFDRITDLSKALLSNNPESAEAYIQAAQISASMHQFETSKDYLRNAEKLNGNRSNIDYVELSILQATGKDQDKVLALRKEKVLSSGAPEDLVPYAALLADTNQIELANSAYLKALKYRHKNPSPFIPAWICFQLGLLWGEIAEPSNKDLASYWYSRALTYIPRYTKARLHLAEIYMGSGKTELAIETLQLAIASTDPEVSWKMSEIYAMNNQQEFSAQYLQQANTIFTYLLEKYPLAFADHAVEFYAGSGKDPEKAYELALLNYQNRPTDRASNLLQRTKKLL